MDLRVNRWEMLCGAEAQGRSRYNSGSKWDLQLRRRPRSVLRGLSHEQWRTGQDTETTNKGGGY